MCSKRRITIVGKEKFDAFRDTHWIEEINEFLANATNLLVELHMAGIAVSSVAHRENLVRGTGQATASGHSTEETQKRPTP